MPVPADPVHCSFAIYSHTRKLFLSAQANLPPARRRLRTVLSRGADRSEGWKAGRREGGRERGKAGGSKAGRLEGGKSRKDLEAPQEKRELCVLCGLSVHRSVPRIDASRISMGWRTLQVRPRRPAAAVICSVQPGFAVATMSGRARRCAPPCGRRARGRFRLDQVVDAGAAAADLRLRRTAAARCRESRAAASRGCCADALRVREVAGVVVGHAQPRSGAAARAAGRAPPAPPDSRAPARGTLARARPTPDRRRAARRTPSSPSRSRRR